MKKAVIALILFATGLTASSQDLQQRSIRVVCGETKKMFNDLATDYGEKPIIYGRGPGERPGIMTMWVNEETLTWTLVVTHSNGTSCIIGGGTDFTIQAPGKHKNISRDKLIYGKQFTKSSFTGIIV